MKYVITTLLFIFGTYVFAALSVTAPTVHVVAKANKQTVEINKQEINCVKKDKNGKCPPAPNGVKPTPKKHK
jgi:hypothetical protein